MNNVFRKFHIGTLFAVIFLVFMEFGMHPLTYGPDRWIHDPAVNRINNPEYMVGDSYTDMAVRSGVYPFYAAIIHFGQILHLGDERWRQTLFLGCLFVAYWSIWKIACLFLMSRFVVPLLAFMHGVVLMLAPPYWMYGPFIQVDGGLAPRSISIAFSFLALYFLLKRQSWLTWMIIGVTTYVHVSNALIVFTLFLGAWIFYEAKRNHAHFDWRDIFKRLMCEGFKAIGIYTLAGGWFAFYAAKLNSQVITTFTDEKFIWTWIYFRAPYMTLSRVPSEFWNIFFLHVTCLFVCWYLLKRKEKGEYKIVDILGLIALGSVGYLYIFYLFSIPFPWLPGFQFYSIRVIYFLYFVSYLFLSLVTVAYFQDVIIFFKKIFINGGIRIRCFLLILLLATIGGFSYYSYWVSVGLLKKIPVNLEATRVRFLTADLIPEQKATIEYIYAESEPVLTPVADWSLPKGSPYLPSVVTVKCFGFTRSGLEKWFERLDDVSKGALSSAYEKQLKKGKFKPTTLNWVDIYRSLSADDVLRLSKKYNFHLFLTYRDLEYPFHEVASDENYRLYSIAFP